MIRLFLLAALCLATYAPTLTVPLLQDDYPNIAQSQTFGTLHGQPQLWEDATFRLRATSYWLLRPLWATAGLNPLPYRIVSLLLHILGTLLLYRLALAWPPMSGAAFWAAAFFAIHEGHQEAVMWVSAVNELFLFVFGLGALLCVLSAKQSKWWHVPGVILFGLALISKESAVILLPLFLLVTWQLSWALVPYIAVAVPAIASVAASRSSSFRFSDGSFSLAAPFWVTLPHSALRLLWLWGIVALILIVYRRLPLNRPVTLALAWIAIALLPYSFLTYSTSIPSRQVYLASAGLALLAGLAFEHVARTADKKIVWALAVVIVFHNAGIIWIKKRAQFQQRAQPTEQLLATVRQTAGPIDMNCFPYTDLIAKEAVRLADPASLPRLQWTGPCRLKQPNRGLQ